MYQHSPHFRRQNLVAPLWENKQQTLKITSKTKKKPQTRTFSFQKQQQLERVAPTHITRKPLAASKPSDYYFTHHSYYVSVM